MSLMRSLSDWFVAEEPQRELSRGEKQLFNRKHLYDALSTCALLDPSKEWSKRYGDRMTECLGLVGFPDVHT